MGRERAGTLGSDENSLGKSLHFLVFIFILLTFAFAYTNLTPGAKELAQAYMLFAVPFIAAVLWDMFARQHGNKPELPDTITVENVSPIFGRIGRKTMAIIVAGSLIGGSLLFLLLGRSSPLQLLAAPHFQAIQPGPMGSALLSGEAGIIENVIFFGLLMPTYFVLLYWTYGRRYGRKAITIALAVLFAAGTFTAYHVAVYGESPQALDQVFEFGLFCAGSTVATGTLLPCHGVHFWNNFSITFFLQTSGDFIIWLVLYWLLIIGATVVYLRRPGH